MAEKTVIRVPFVKSEECPYCKRPLIPGAVKCRLRRRQGTRIAMRQLYQCASCDIWFGVHGKTKTAFSGIRIPHFPLQNLTLDRLKTMVYGADQLEQSNEHIPAVTWVDHATPAAPSKTIRPKCAKRPQQTRNERPLGEKIFRNYAAPESTVTIVFYQTDGSPDLQHLFLVDNDADHDVANSRYYIACSTSRRIITCILDRSLVFTLGNGESSQQCQISHYFVGPAMEARLNGYDVLRKLEQGSGKIVDIQIYDGKGLCREHGDLTECATVWTSGSRNPEPQPIVVYYCPICDEYYVNRDRYLQFCKRNGIPPFRLYSDDFSHSPYSNTERFGTLNDESVLKLYGYDVSQSSSLSIRQRRDLLDDLIDSGILSKARIISHLEWLIRMHKNGPYHHAACAAWRSDIAYIEQYHNDDGRVIWGRFTPGRKKRI